MVRAMLLLHFFDQSTFIGQTMTIVELSTINDLRELIDKLSFGMQAMITFNQSQKVVLQELNAKQLTLPDGTKIDIPPPHFSFVESHEQFRNATSIHVMQVILNPSFDAS